MRTRLRTVKVCRPVLISVLAFLVGVPACGGGGSAGSVAADASMSVPDALSLDGAKAPDGAADASMTAADALSLDGAKAPDVAAPILPDGDPSAPVEIRFTQPGNIGIFDPSVEGDTNGTVYMAYSSATSEAIAGINIRMASSSDGGRTWVDTNQVLFAVSQMALPAPNNTGTWQYEVSSLVRDDGAPTNERWKVFAHRYMVIGGVPNHPLGWIALKTAASPLGPWSSERKIFTGSAYMSSLDALIGPSENSLSSMFSGALSDCAAFTEPGAYSDGTSVYLAINCATAASATNRMVLLKRTYPSGAWTYQGVLLKHADAVALGRNDMMAGDIFAAQGKVYLAVSPSSATYEGCLVYRITSLDTATLEAEGSGKKSYGTVARKPPADLSGACTYDAALTRSGLLYFDRMDFSLGLPATHLMKSFLTF